MPFGRLRKAMYRSYMRSYPQPVPQTLRELLLQQQWKKISSSIDGDDNLYAGSISASDGSHHVAFLSQRMRDFTSRINIIQADGTFRARPNVPPSSQVFVLVTPWRNAVLPIGWVLMESRSASAHRAVLTLIKQVCPNLDPAVVVTDWEFYQQKAWDEAFPNSEVQGCLWHLCRAFIKKCKQLRLLRFRRALPHLLTFVRRACPVSLFPVRFFRVGLGVLRREARETNIVTAYVLEPFFRYVNDNWINRPYRKKWMSFFNTQQRTNNCCESHNRMLRKAVGAYRPNIYAFIAALARLEHKTYLDIEQMERGDCAKRSRRWQSVYADRALAALSDDLCNEVFRQEC